ncbi:phosphate ABC transporter substrate-binding protein (PhoT family) [Herbihabitans rhizosphaerae]|uniref:Phosphate-binding protein n=1 Tax=Herbihabitans rhizosphaerae TaxID=1872711 RepID=A0A4Q7L6I5_9PSEU|nr:phosphate ABC transporter substrate-binding protein PstS [Herbihabitans rhizosphaerae]RZS44924.1 phosphate ABC transporter substrate-binding protein (PhoT family) [Herbihabitans rhizosphaerae]
MKIKRHASVLALIAAGALALSACGSDQNTNSGGSSPSGTGNSNAAGVKPDCEGVKEAIKASGSSAQANAIARFQVAYQNACSGKKMDYNSNGSGNGVKEFLGKQTDFGGSDSPLSKDKGEVQQATARCDGAPAWNLPAVFGPIAITYNVKGADGLVLDGSVLGKIFSGQITTWNDPAIAALNQGKTLPGDKITVIFRSDESGTTDNFQQYLEASSKGTWTKGKGKVFNGGIGEGAKGNENTSAAIARTPGSITYNEWSFAKQNKLQIAKIVNSGGGEAVELNSASAGKAIEGAKVKGQGNDLELDLKSIYATPTPGAYPLVLAAYEIVCSKYTDQAQGKAVKAFLTAAVTTGQRGLEDNGYIPVPEAFQTKLLTAIGAIA